MEGVSEKTAEVLKVLMTYKELDKYNLVGGTGLAIHLKHRLSEDIDLFSYNPSFPGKKFPLPDKVALLDRINSDFESVKYDYNDKQDVTLFANGVKIQLRSEHQFHGPKEASKLGYINLPSLKELLGMKLVALYLRNEWRDVYDLTCLAKRFDLKEFYPAYEKIMSSKYCGTKARKVNLYDTAISKLQNPELIKSLHQKDAMTHLITNHQVTPQDVHDTFKSLTLQTEKPKKQGLSR